MKNYPKSLLAIGLVSVLTGCKLAVMVPSGGDVTSASGTRNCTAGSLCEFNITDTTFNESFTAMPKPGYKFTKWQGGNGFLCADSINSTCMTSNTSYAGNADVEAIIATEQKFSIKPLFEATATLDSLAATSAEQAERLKQLEDMLQSRYGVPVVVDANDKVVGTLVDAVDLQYHGVYSQILIATKFKETGDEAFLLSVRQARDGSVKGGRGRLLFESPNCTGTPFMDMSVDNTSPGVAGGPDNTTWVPDSRESISTSNYGETYYSYYEPDNSACYNSATPTFAVPAVSVEMNFQFPLRVVFR